MKIYIATFKGRLKGAIGITYNINTTVKGINKKKARLKLYDTYSHIECLKLKEV